jgi:hypothetical protein
LIRAERSTPISERMASLPFSRVALISSVTLFW